uniref:Uncharacterized protein n=1 Tax=Eutreptiella gymnastica TaxID=73025 RepID=A0A7S1NXH8_9EUGL
MKVASIPIQPRTSSGQASMDKSGCSSYGPEDSCDEQTRWQRWLSSPSGMMTPPQQTLLGSQGTAKTNRDDLRLTTVDKARVARVFAGKSSEANHTISPIARSKKLSQAPQKDTLVIVPGSRHVLRHHMDAALAAESQPMPQGVTYTVDRVHQWLDTLVQDLMQRQDLEPLPLAATDPDDPAEVHGHDLTPQAGPPKSDADGELHAKGQDTVGSTEPNADGAPRLSFPAQQVGPTSLLDRGDCGTEPAQFARYKDLEGFKFGRPCSVDNCESQCSTVWDQAREAESSLLNALLDVVLSRPSDGCDAPVTTEQQLINAIKRARAQNTSWQGSAVRPSSKAAVTAKGEGYPAKIPLVYAGKCSGDKKTKKNKGNNVKHILAKWERELGTNSVNAELTAKLVSVQQELALAKKELSQQKAYFESVHHMQTAQFCLEKLEMQAQAKAQYLECEELNRQLQHLKQSHAEELQTMEHKAAVPQTVQQQLPAKAVGSELQHEADLFRFSIGSTLFNSLVGLFCPVLLP